MIIESTQKVIKVGSSLAVTIPAREAKRANITVGKPVKYKMQAVQDEVPQKVSKLQSEYDAFKAQYHQTLKNLSKR
jgi:antitoxin component of MazEF toxin-antitoxin module